MNLETARPQTSNDHTILLLPKHTNVAALAEDCREVALAFLDESQFWGKAELATWLIGPYSRITQIDLMNRPAARAGAVPLLRDIDPEEIDQLIARTRERVVGVLLQIVDSDFRASFVAEMISAGFIARCDDRTGAEGWLPTTEARLLADRVLSLIAVDCLMHASDYDARLSVCASPEPFASDDVEAPASDEAPTSFEDESTEMALRSTWAPAVDFEQLAFVQAAPRVTLPYFGAGA